MSANSKKKVAVAMSGGVDSSVAAALLKKQGYFVTGVFMKFWNEANSYLENKCCSLDAHEDARKVAEKLNIPLYAFNFKNDFKKQVVDDFLEKYQNGLTPNPCVRCNQFIKFGLFLKKTKALGCDYIATGHYAQIKKAGDNYYLLKGKDKTKDQSYFLWALKQEQLKHILFPVGKYNKIEVRKLAKKFNLPVHNKKDSQEICFTPKHHNEFLKKHLKLKPGPIMTLAGQKIGQHQGLPLYTIGQRKGIAIGGIGPFYAVKLDYQKNILWVARKFNDKAIYKKNLIIKEVNWLAEKPFKCQAKVRYGHPAVSVVIKKNKVEFKKPQRAITPGQSIVFYQGEQVFGGGVIQ
ncbi:MAG: tRNA 2-thiouridine(34) synthase MnmA [bacterium]